MIFFIFYFQVLQGMWGVEDHRPLTVLPAPSKDAMLLMSDIDGTLIGDQDATVACYLCCTSVARLLHFCCTCSTFVAPLLQ
jgi:hypothetical protein